MRRPKPGERWRHISGDVYLIVDENNLKLVNTNKDYLLKDIGKVYSYSFNTFSDHDLSKVWIMVNSRVIKSNKPQWF